MTANKNVASKQSENSLMNSKWNIFKKIIHTSFYWHKILYYVIITGFAIWVLGVAAYCGIYSSYPATEVHRWFEILVRSMSSSLALFAFSIDSNAIDGWLSERTGSPFWGYTIAMLALLAGIWTIFFIIRLVWKTISSLYSRYKDSELQHDNLYIFWGINGRSLQLAKDIERNDKSGYSIFIALSEDEKDEYIGLQKIINRSRQRTKLQAQISEIKSSSVLIAEQPIREVNINSDTWHQMGIRLIERFVENCKSKIHVFLFSDNETKNIDDSLQLNHKELWADKYDKLTIHCLARRGNANRLIEDVTANSVIEIIDSSHLAIDVLKQDVNNHPVNFVDIENGMVSSEFNCLIVGFSECGQDALRFLYEYGAFVSSESITSDDKKMKIKRSPFHCHVVDRKINAAAARWIHHAKQMFENTNTKDGDKMITFLEKDYADKEFYNVLDKIIDKLNYVVIAVGDDKEGITLAVDILRYAIAHGRIKLNNSNEHFRIYVRSYDDNMLEYLTKIEKHYNMDNEQPICIFGKEEDIYTKRILIDDNFTELSKKYQHQYEDCRVKHNIGESNPTYWDERRTQIFEKAKKGNALKELQNLRRQESQDRANALHALTKLAIKDAAGETQATNLEEKMCWLEHIRWQAAHEIMGYQLGEKDIQRYKHNCMIPWEELDTDTREYDKAVWLTTLELEQDYKRLNTTNK